MRNPHRHAPVILALILASLLTSCDLKSLFSRDRIVLWKTKRKGKSVTEPQNLMRASKKELNDRILRLYSAINSFQATVDMVPSSGSVYEGRITELAKDIHAFVLFRKSSDIRIQAQTPVIRTQAFDMVSNGKDFRFFLNSKNLFITGMNDAPTVSKNKIENLRPDAFFSSMLIRPADAPSEELVLMDQTDEENPRYVLLFMKKSPAGETIVSRSVWFDRIDLSIERQMVFDDAGEILSDTRYAKWQPYNGVMFPAHIDLNRWKDGYGVVMNVLDMKMNKVMTDEQFLLNQPEGSQLQVLGEKSAAERSSSAPKEPNH